MFWRVRMRLCLVPGRPEREVCEALGNIPNLSEIQNELDTCRAPSLPQVAMLENIIIYIYISQFCFFLHWQYIKHEKRSKLWTCEVFSAAVDEGGKGSLFPCVLASNGLGVYAQKLYRSHAWCWLGVALGNATVTRCCLRGCENTSVQDRCRAEEVSQNHWKRQHQNHQMARMTEHAQFILIFYLCSDILGKWICSLKKEPFAACIDSHPQELRKKPSSWCTEIPWHVSPRSLVTLYSDSQLLY